MDSPLERPQLIAGPEAIEQAVVRVAGEVSADHPDGVVLVGVLKGSILFLADLARRLTIPVRIELVAVAPFDGAATRTRVVKDLDRPITGDAAVLVTGITDTGFTADFLTRHLLGAGAATVRVATLADKAARRLIPLVPDYRAVIAPDQFLIGYGLDYQGRYRNLAGLWGVDGQALAEQPGRHVAELYGPGATSE